MPRIRCTHCGKTLDVPPEAGAFFLCTACGHRNNASVMPGSPEWAALRQTVERDVSKWRDAQSSGSSAAPIPFKNSDVPVAEASHARPAGSPVAAAIPDMPATAPQLMPASASPEPNATGQRQVISAGAWAIAIALIALIIVLPFVIYALMQPEPPDHSDVLAMQRQAESLVASGDLAAAHIAYSDLFRYVSTQQIDDPAILERLDKAKTDQERIFAILREQARRKKQAELAAATPQPTLQPTSRPTTEPAIVVKNDPPAPATQALVARATPATQPATAPAVAMQAPIARRAAIPRPPIRVSRPEEDGITDQEIGESIQRGASFLLAQFKNGRIGGDGNTAFDPGLNALCVYALLQSGHAIPDERLNGRAKTMKDMLDKMRNSRMDGYETYGRAIRATALAVYNRAEDRDALKADMTWLINATRSGAYTYGSGNRTDPGNWDNSNSQYGLLGVWSGAEVGMEVPRSYWSGVQKHWYECQHESGEWSYGRGGYGGSGTLSMSVAGIASLFVTHDYLEAPQFGSHVGREPFSRPLARGLAWLEQGDNCLRITEGWPGYTLYGIERVGLASGFKYFGAHDWYRVLATRVMDGQAEDGSWSNRGRMRLRLEASAREELIETAYSLLFLARGRHPIIMNKLRFAGAWANRPRDVANLARFASRELERPLNWQVIPIERDWTEWMDSPILYFASHVPPKFTETEITKLRRFIDAGGMLLTQADGGGEHFNQFILELSRKLLPNLQWSDLPLDHEIYSLNYRIEPRPRLRCISNGARILMLHMPQDLTQFWQLRSEKSQRSVFELGVNLFIYAAGKADLRNRLSSSYIPPARNLGSHQMRLGRLKYSGLWDPEPGAFPRFARWFGYQTGYELLISAITPAELDATKFPVVHLTGTAPWNPGEAEAAMLRRYVSEGGVLLIDACGGAWPFGQSISAGLIPRIFADAPMSVIDTFHPLLIGEGDGMDNLAKPQLRAYTEQKLGKSAGRIEMYKLGNGRIIYSSIDLSSGLLGSNTWSILGYRPAYAQSFVKNVLLWTADGAVD